MQSRPDALKARCNQEARLPCPSDVCLRGPCDVPYLEEERDGGGDGLCARRGDVGDEREQAVARVAVAAHEDAAELREPQRLGIRAMVRGRGDAAVTLSLISAAVSSKRRWERGMSPFCTAQTHRHTDTQTHRLTDAQTHRRTDAQTHKRIDTQTRRHADARTHRHPPTAVSRRSWMISP